MNDWHLLRCYACVHSILISFACAIWRLVIVQDTCPCCKLISKNISTLAFKCSLGNVVLMRFWYLSQTETASTPATDCWSAGRFYQFVCAYWTVFLHVFMCVYFWESCSCTPPGHQRAHSECWECILPEWWGCCWHFPFFKYFFFSSFLLVNICFITTAVCDDPHLPSLKD